MRKLKNKFTNLEDIINLFYKNLYIYISSSSFDISSLLNSFRFTKNFIIDIAQMKMQKK